MAVLLKATDTQYMENHWRAKLDAIRWRYASEPSPELKMEYLRVLKEFANLVLRGERPRV